jgi:histidinol-phosphate/aromatic aminotransferase/cobyric acid decarboxylase-like protein
MENRAAHGGAFFNAVGEDFEHLERLHDVISADVLDAWFDPSPKVLEKLRAFLPELLRTSPPLDAGGLVQTIARTRGVLPGQVLTGAGSSDLIFTCLPRLAPPGCTVMITDPVYGEYPHVRRHVLSAEDGFHMDGAAILGDVEKYKPDLIVIVNPNSPTGRLWPREEALQFIRELPPPTRILFDETYVEFAGTEHSLERDIADYPNLLVMKSMSKAYALSGIRAGYLVANPSLIDQLRPMMPPWAISLLAQIAAVEALKDAEYYAARYAETRELRGELADDMEGIPGLRVYHSDANFLLVECTDHPMQPLLERTRAEGVFLRDCSSISARLAHYFRVGVKTRAQNQRIAAAIRRALGVA